MSSPANTQTIPCAYCASPDTVKRGFREKKRENVQLYLCRSCLRTFTPAAAKGKHYSISVIIDTMSYYNLGFSLEQSCKIIKQKTGCEPSSSTVANWIEEHKDLCRYYRYRSFAIKMCKPTETVVTATLAHRQLYRFMFHRPKIRLIIREDIKHARFGPLADFLALIPSETPHQYFQEGLRMSESPLKFSREQMIVRSKHNFANQLAAFALQAVKKNKDRHQAVQKFMLANDTVTVATEVPVYLKREDLLHMQTQLGFEIYAKPLPKLKNRRSSTDIVGVESKTPAGQRLVADVAYAARDIVPRVPCTQRRATSASGRAMQLRQLSAAELPRLITGHIDLVQIRNGQIHIMDYKPNAAKEKPIEQLTLYAMALSRLTGLRMYCFKCAWFDEKDYFEFFPLHVVYKGRGKKRKARIDRKNIVNY